MASSKRKKDGGIACTAQEVFFKKNIFFYLCQESNRCWWAGRTPMIGIANQSTEAIQAIRCIDQLKVSDQFMVLLSVDLQGAPAPSNGLIYH
jgi:hypothetical protein